MNNNKFEMRFHHDHDHDHAHDHHHHHHGDDHHHHHHHEEENENKEEKTLRVLLVHWVNHNQSHEESFKEWVDKSRNMGKEDVAVNIEKAIEYMKKANEMFVEAKKHM